MPKLQIVLLCTAAAIAYGVVHDQVTAHLCVEYFTVAHPPLFHTTSPALLGLCWGIAAPLGLGLLVGVLLAVVSQSEGVPPAPMRQLLRSVCGVLAIMAVSATLAGLIGFELSRRSIITIPAALSNLIPQSRHDRFMAVWFVHAASYFTGLFGSTWVLLRLWQARGRPRVLATVPRTMGGILRVLSLAAIATFVVWWRFFMQ